MVRATGKLKALTVERAKMPGMYADGAGLWLQVKSAGAKSWVFRFKIKSIAGGKARMMGLGSAQDIGLAEAREKAAACRRLIAAGKDPIAERKAELDRQQLEASKAKTFAFCAEACIAARRPDWRNAKHADQWINSLRDYVLPTLGALPVGEIDTDLVLAVLLPIWNAKPETAGRVRSRIEIILDWAKARNYRDGENPARWRGHLINLLPKHSKKRRVQHHPALNYDEIPAFMAALRAEPGIASLALQYTVLTAARSAETLGALRSEINGDASIWTVPANRIKAGREHRVPLAPAASAIARAMLVDHEGAPPDAFLFPGLKRGEPLVADAMLNVLRGLGFHQVTVHGFRSSFRDWVGDCTNFSEVVAEAALAHAVGDATEQAYRRGDALEKRALLMAAWADFCLGGKGATILPIRGSGTR